MAVRRSLPDAEDLAVAVAAELGEPVDDVRLSVLIGTIALSGQLGPEAAVAGAIGTELGHLQAVQSPRSPARLMAIESLEELLVEARRLQTEGSLDLETIVAIQRASGAVAARTDRPMVALLHRYAVTRRQMWEHSVAATQAGLLEPDLLAAFGRFLLLWNELTSLAVSEGYRIAERDVVARAVEARRGTLQELLGVVTDDAASHARLRREAVRNGLDPDRTYMLVAVAALPNVDATLDLPVTGDEELELTAGRIGHLLGSPASGADGVGAGIRLPAVLPLMGRIAVLAQGDWIGLSRMPKILDSVLGVVAAPAASGARPRKHSRIRSGQAAWVAIASRVIDGVDSLAGTYADLVDASRTAEKLGRRGWIEDPDEVALERLFLSNPHLADATVRRELGPLHAERRLGGELIETLQAFFDAGENVTATARQLHLATRTVGYRLEKIESLLGHPLEGEHGRRLSAALMVWRLNSAEPGREAT